jgi:hypothetical protein
MTPNAEFGRRGKKWSWPTLQRSICFEERRKTNHKFDQGAYPTGSKENLELLIQAKVLNILLQSLNFDEKQINILSHINGGML